MDQWSNKDEQQDCNQQDQPSNSSVVAKEHSCHFAQGAGNLYIRDVFDLGVDITHKEVPNPHECAGRSSAVPYL